ncbi:MAG: CHRD domain-containing protein [Nitriliruptoraceae bacterium]|nr:CHRD domain-containing protein [Nitriliruptoraceae bacterium]
MMTARRISRRLLVGASAGALLALSAVPAAADTHDHGHDGPMLVDEPASFTSMWSIPADADQVPGDGGEPGATGRFDLRMDAATDTICFDLELRGVTPPYESPAETATHIHQGPTGEAGPPRVVFPDPEMHDDGTLTSTGCVAAPFVTGLSPDGSDTDHGADFTVAALEADPTAFYVDTHTSEYPDGAIRGQFTAQPVPMGGMDTGDGSVTGAVTAGTVSLGAGALALALGGTLGLAAIAARRHGDATV